MKRAQPCHWRKGAYCKSYVSVLRANAIWFTVRAFANTYCFFCRITIYLCFLCEEKPLETVASELIARLSKAVGSMAPAKQGNSSVSMSMSGIGQR